MKKKTGGAYIAKSEHGKGFYPGDCPKYCKLYYLGNIEPVHITEVFDIIQLMQL